MRKIREVLRLRMTLAHSPEKIARAVGIAETTVRRYLTLWAKTGLTWPLPEDLSDDELEITLFPPIQKIRTGGGPLPDFAYIHKELKRKGVTLHLLWREYSIQEKAYSYSQFCLLYQRWREEEKSYMMQIHKAGDCTFIDYVGLTIPITDAATGEITFKAQIFVATLGASGYIFCEATRTQTSEDWIGSHRKMCEFFGGVTKCWGPDNLKAAVNRSDRYEPVLNTSYLCAAEHYGTCILPARVRKPQDKSKVESSVYSVETQILAPLRDRTFFSLEELNAEIEPALKSLNNKPFQKMPGSSRYSLYLEIDKPALSPLPDTPFEFFQWGSTVVDSGYHIFIEGIPYSVPYKLIGHSIEFRYNERVVEFFYKGKQITLHLRSHTLGQPVTKDNHRPIRHQYQAKCTPEEIYKTAQDIGAKTLEWVDHVLRDSSLHIRQRINTTLCVVRLTKTHSNSRLNAACDRALFYHNFKAAGIKDILQRGLDKSPLPKQELINPLPQEHKNVRGAGYYR